MYVPKKHFMFQVLAVQVKVTYRSTFLPTDFLKLCSRSFRVTRPYHLRKVYFINYNTQY